MNFKIKNIDKTDKNQVHKLIDQINKQDNLSYSLSDEWLDYVIDLASQGIFLGFDGENLAAMGTAMINPVYKDQATLNIVVSPKYRKKGLASMLYDEIYNYVKKEGVEIVECFVKQRLDLALKFVEKRGFNTAMYSWEMELSLEEFDFNSQALLGLNFRKVNKQDAVNYNKIIYNAFGDKLGEDDMIKTLEDPSVIIYILEKDKQAIGSITAQVRQELKLAYIYDIAILKQHRGQGFGSNLIKSAIEDLKQNNIETISLSVTGENKRALELYKKIGFKEVDMDLIMTKEL